MVVGGAGKMSRPEPLPRIASSILGKALAILDAFTADDRDLSLAELGRRTALPKGTLHRVAGDLVDAGLLRRSGTRYQLSTKLFVLGMRVATELSLLEVATPFLEDLYEQAHETVHLGVRDGQQVVYVAKIGGHRQASAPSRIGGRMPLHCTALGKVLLAHATGDVRAAVLSGRLRRTAPRTITNASVLAAQLDAIAASGVSFDHEESAVGLACVAAPITDASGGVVAAVSVTGPVARFAPEAHRANIRVSASGISQALRRRQQRPDH